MARSAASSSCCCGSTCRPSRWCSAASSTRSSSATPARRRRIARCTDKKKQPGNHFPGCPAILDGWTHLSTAPNRWGELLALAEEGRREQRRRGRAVRQGPGPRAGLDLIDLAIVVAVDPARAAVDREP